MISLLTTVLIWYGSGCWEDANGNYVLYNQTTKTNCQTIETSIQAGIPETRLVRTVVYGKQVIKLRKKMTEAPKGE